VTSTRVARSAHAALAAVVALSAACSRAHPGAAPAPAQPPAVYTPPASPTAASPGDTLRLPISEITRRAVEVFGDSVATGADSAADAGTDEPTWDIDVRSYETHERVEHYVRLFTTDARERIVERIQRGTRYEPMIRAKLQAAGLPEDMTYLALIESGYNPHAYSRAAAVGMWQLMTSTARGAGLRVDWWVDERRDPVRATDAAIRFLRYLKEQFGSLYLAAAAYNGGPGRISRGLSRFADDLEGTSGEDVFFALAEKDYLRAETKNYVPQLIAAALIAKNPAHYGLTVTPELPFGYDSVRVDAATPLAAVAKASGVPLADVLELNPHLLRGITPPGDGRFTVRLPIGRSAGFDSAYARLAPRERTAFTRVISVKGQRLASIADDAGLTERQIAWYNRGLERLKSGRLRPGQTILVPSAAVIAAARDVPDPAVERYGSPATPAIKLHVVRRGESLGRIAERFGTTVPTLMRLNGLRKRTVFPGQALVVKGPKPKAGRSAAAKPELTCRTLKKGKTRGHAKECVVAERSDAAAGHAEEARSKRGATGGAKRASKPESKSATKAESKTESKGSAKAAAKAAAKTAAKTRARATSANVRAEGAKARSRRATTTTAKAAPTRERRADASPAGRKKKGARGD
jgi:membrane-bound lytic murein transglycosylase D